MKQISKLLGFYKVENYIDVIILSGKTKYSYNRIKEQISNKIFPPIFVILLASFFVTLILWVFSQSVINAILMTVTLLLLTFSEVVIKDSPSLYLKSIGKIFTKKTKKNFDINLKDEEFITFINEYYPDIKKLYMSKKRTIKFINNWKENEEILINERIKSKAAK